MKNKITIFWFKRDLRLVDNEALARALESRSKILLIYIYEPDLWKDPHYDERHLNFIKESLTDLNSQLKVYKTEILCIQSGVLEAFEQLLKIYDISAVFSTQETGLDITYQRDVAFSQFCLKHAIVWREFQNNGVIRGLRNRKTWRTKWYTYMKAPIFQTNFRNANFTETNEITKLYHRFLKFNISTKTHNFQKGGSTEGYDWMASFFEERIAYYSDYISKPALSRYGCSRLSPYFAWGNLSIREVYQKALSAKESSRYKKELNAFISRLRWQSHFIQKFEMEPRMEFEAVNKGFLTMEQPVNEAYVKAYISGNTGFPLVDASIRCVTKTGYINFRMRSMIVSFFTHHLFQHFSLVGPWLARQFLDFEPGIHYGQMQMQAGFTGTNTVRVYNPVKNSLDHDSEALFIKEYVPELAGLPIDLAIEPWRITAIQEKEYKFVYGADYPKRIVDTQETRKFALQRLYGQRKNELAKKEKERILETHTIRRKDKK